MALIKGPHCDAREAHPTLVQTLELNKRFFMFRGTMHRASRLVACWRLGESVIRKRRYCGGRTIRIKADILKIWPKTYQLKKPLNTIQIWLLPDALDYLRLGIEVLHGVMIVRLGVSRDMRRRPHKGRPRRAQNCDNSCHVSMKVFNNVRLSPYCVPVLWTMRKPWKAEECRLGRVVSEFTERWLGPLPRKSLSTMNCAHPGRAYFSQTPSKNALLAMGCERGKSEIMCTWTVHKLAEREVSIRCQHGIEQGPTTLDWLPGS